MSNRQRWLIGVVVACVVAVGAWGMYIRRSAPDAEPADSGPARGPADPLAPMLRVSEQSPHLDLSGRGLTEVPPEVLEMTFLESLNLSSNEIMRRKRA